MTCTLPSPRIYLFRIRSLLSTTSAQIRSGVDLAVHMLLADVLQGLFDGSDQRRPVEQQTGEASVSDAGRHRARSVASERRRERRSEGREQRTGAALPA